MLSKCIDTKQHRSADLGAHVPHSAHTVAASCHEDVQAGVQRQGVHATQVPVVLPDDLHSKRMPMKSGPTNTAGGELEIPFC